jgi:hypothetical protein
MGLINLSGGFVSALPFLMLKALGVLLTYLAAFFWFDKYQEIGLTSGIFGQTIISVFLILAGQYIFWVLIFNKNAKWDLF